MNINMESKQIIIDTLEEILDEIKCKISSYKNLYTINLYQGGALDKDKIFENGALSALNEVKDFILESLKKLKKQK